MRGIQFIKHDTKIDFIGKRWLIFIFSLLVCLGTLVGLGVKGLKYGIDFEGGDPH